MMYHSLSMKKEDKRSFHKTQNATEAKKSSYIDDMPFFVSIFCRKTNNFSKPILKEEYSVCPSF